jgi:Zn-dependent peptidase ImmA (M78 family)/transcriptional regulator with XRE-family HTH domain
VTPSDDVAAAQVLFVGQRLALAREYNGVRKVDVARGAGVSPAAVTQWEQGRTRPTRGALAAVSLYLGFDPSFFSSDRPTLQVREEATHFRSLRATTKRQRHQLLSRLELLSEMLAVVDEHVALPAVDIPQLDVNDGLRDAVEAADAVRRAWGFGPGPISNVVRTLEAKGIIVAKPRLATTDVDAFSRWLGERPVIVLACDKDDAARSRFDAAHELGHLVMHHDAEPGDPALERQADAFAAEFLMPAATIGPELPSRLSWQSYFQLKHRWGTSLAALVRRARDLGVISQYAYERAQVQISANGWRRQEPYPLEVTEEPRLLARALALMESEFGVGRSAVAERLRLREEQMTALWGDVAGATASEDHVRIALT